MVRPDGKGGKRESKAYLRFSKDEKSGFNGGVERSGGFGSSLSVDDVLVGSLRCLKGSGQQDR
jgi:hypothetical protein